MKIFCFTTTGNSLAVARAIGGELFSIIKVAGEGRHEWSDEETIGVVCPVYFGRLPAPVEYWLDKVNLVAPYKFLVLTCGNTPACAVADSHDWDYVASIKMVDNYFPMFDVARQVRELPAKHVDEQLARVVDDISVHRSKREQPTLYGRIAGWYMRLFPLSADAYKRFYIEYEKCIGCGICERICPIDNIKMIESRPEIGARCMTCGGCYHNCPEGAIRYRGEKSRYQYRHPQVSLTDLIKMK